MARGIGITLCILAPFSAIAGYLFDWPVAAVVVSPLTLLVGGALLMWTDNGDTDEEW